MCGKPKFTEKEWSVIRDCLTSVDAGGGDTRPWSDDPDKRSVVQSDLAFDRVLKKLGLG